MVLTKEQERILKAKAKLLEPMVRIGKNGLADSVVRQVYLLVCKRKLVKIKFLKSFLEGNDRKDAAKKLADATGSDVVEQVGFVVVLNKR
jgi:RNA-binding protein